MAEIRSWATTLNNAVERRFGEHAHISFLNAGYYPADESLYFVFTMTFENERAFNVFKLKHPDKLSVLETMRSRLEVIFKDHGVLNTQEFLHFLRDKAQ